MIDHLLFTIYHLFFSKVNNQSGQTLLIVVLVMVMALTIGLSVASRSIISLRTATEEENSQRAFSAAEAGVEKALKENRTITPGVPLGNIGTNAIIRKAELKDISGRQFLLKSGNSILKDDGADVWLSTYPTYAPPLYNGTLTFHFKAGSADPCDSGRKTAAIMVIVMSGSALSPVSNRYTFDPCGSRRSGNNFSTATASTLSLGGISFSYKTDSITVSNGLIARVIPLYESTPIGIEGSAALPNQAKQVEAVGESGGTVRQVTYYQGFPELPPEFFYVIFQPK